MAVHVPTGAQHLFGLRVPSAQVAWPATPAWPKPGLLGRLGQGEKNHLLSRRLAAGTGRTTINPRAPYSVDKSAVKATVTIQHSFPVTFFVVISGVIHFNEPLFAQVDHRRTASGFLSEP